MTFFKHGKQVFKCKAFPRCPQFRMPLQSIQSIDIQKSVEDAGIADKYLGRLNDSLARIFKPGRKAADEKSSLQQL